MKTSDKCSEDTQEKLREYNSENRIYRCGSSFEYCNGRCSECPNYEHIIYTNNLDHIE